MKFNIVKTRKGRLEEKIRLELESPTPNIQNILNSVDDYEKDNLETIEKLRREKKIEMNRISGAIKQCLKAHPIITKELTGSLSKRIYGSLLNNTKPVREKKLTWRMVEITIWVGLIIYIIKTLI